MSMTRVAGAALAVALLVPASALAGSQKYPGPGDPGKVQPRKGGKAVTFIVCPKRKRGCNYTKIQKAIDKARGGDTVKVRPGVYRENLKITGKNKSELRLIGDPKKPDRVKLDGKTLKGVRAQNGLLINGADDVTVSGFHAQNYKANGFFVTNVTGYKLTKLKAHLTGRYGIYAFNAKGGLMADSEAWYQNDSGFYIGQTPPQSKPKRSIVRNVEAYGNVIGFSGTNMKYVTITKSRWYNNGIGIVPNALDSEKYAPPEDNAIVDNDIFWNNFNYFAGAPFPVVAGATGDVAYPVGTGILLFGGQKHTIERNRIYGNYLMGVGAIKQILLEKSLKERPDAADLKDNVVRNNDFDLGGKDLNGRDMFYDGSGSGNCFAGNTGATTNVPADNSTFAACPFTGANTFNGSAQLEAINWTVADPTHEAFWIRNPHAPKPGYTPLERYTEEK